MKYAYKAMLEFRYWQWHQTPTAGADMRTILLICERILTLTQVGPTLQLKLIPVGIVGDCKWSLQAMRHCKTNLCKIQNVLADSAYVGQPLAQAVMVQIAKRGEFHKFPVIPKRWVVERSFAWLDKNRRLWKTCEKKLDISFQFIHLAFLALLLRRS